MSAIDFPLCEIRAGLARGTPTIQHRYSHGIKPNVRYASTALTLGLGRFWVARAESAAKPGFEELKFTVFQWGTEITRRSDGFGAELESKEPKIKYIAAEPRPEAVTVQRAVILRESVLLSCAPPKPHPFLVGVRRL
jgi:hypothetical protein